jgi:hypothetical protein
MTLISMDAIVQADATLIVGVVFLVALKQAWSGREENLSRADRNFVVAALLCYILSAIAAVLPDMSSSLGLVFSTPTAANAAYATGLSVFFSYALFYVGMGVTAGAVYSMTRA